MQKGDELTGRQVRKELWTGIVLFVLAFLPGNVLVENKPAYTLGLLLGGMVAIGMVGHMYVSIERALCYEEDTAKGKIKQGSFFRMLFMGGVLMVAVLFTEYVSVIGVFLGLLSLKFSAYIQPLTHKAFLKFVSKGR